MNGARDTLQRTPSLPELRAEVHRARAVHRELLDHQSGKGPLVGDARDQARDALERFVDGLMLRSLPVPREIHAELDMLRRLSGVRRP